MTSTLNVDGRDFTFPSGWSVSKFDEWAYYVNRFQAQSPGYKAVDLVAMSPKNELFLIEVKDYTDPKSLKPTELPTTVAKKVVDTLAALIPAAVNANNSSESLFAEDARKCGRIRVVFHCELPTRHVPVVDKADVLQKLKKLLRAIDPHPMITDSASSSVAWSVGARRLTT